MENKMELQTDKAQTLLGAMGEDYKSLKELREESGVPHISVLTLLQSLRKQGIIVKHKHHSVYRLSFKGRVYKSKHMTQ